MRVLLWVLSIFAVLIVVGEVTWHGVIVPTLQLRQVHIESDINLAKELVLRYAGLSEDTLFHTINTKDIEKQLAAIPMVGEAKVSKSFPSTLTIKLTGREALGVILSNKNNTSIPAVFDREGVVFSTGITIPKRTVPVLSGVQMTSELKPGSRLSGDVLPILQNLASLKQNDPTLFRLISEIRLLRTADNKIEMLLYPVAYPVPIRISSYIDPLSCNYAFLVLETLRNQNSYNVNEIDMRSGTIVLKTRREEDAVF